VFTRFPRVVRVEGYSMTPTLVDGDLVVVRGVRSVRTGDVVVARFRSRPDLLVVKRVNAAAPGGGWLLRSDNEAAGTDSRAFGVADVLGVARWTLRGTIGRRVTRHSGWRARLPTAIGSDPRLDESE
jgi:nickel-type superoxide dismutase maturation protease